MESAATRRATLLVAFMWGAYFLNYCDRQVVSALFSVLKTELKFTDEQLGLTGAYFLWVYGACCPLAGILGDKVSKRLLVVLSLALWSLITIVTGFSAGPTMLLGLRAAMGVSEALYMPSAIALTTSAFPVSRRSRVIAGLTTAQVAGTVAGSSFGGWMGDLGIWRWAFFGLGAAGLLYAVPYLLFLRGVHEAAPGAPASSPPGAKFTLRTLIKIPSYMLLCVVFPVFVFGLWLIYSWLPNFFEEKFILSRTSAALNATVFLQGSTLIGILGGGVLADWLYRRTPAARFWLLVASLVFCAPCLHALGHCASLNATRVAAAAFGLFSGLLMGNIFPAAFEVVPAEARASAVGVLNFCGSILSGLGPYFGGAWKKSLGIDGLLTRTGFAYAAAGLVLIIGTRMLLPRDYALIRSSHAPNPDRGM